MKDSPKKKLYKILFDLAAIIFLVIVCAIWYYLKDSKKADNIQKNIIEQTAITTGWRWLVGDMPIPEDVEERGRVPLTH